MTPPPVVLLHGWGGTCDATWTGWPAALAAMGRQAWRVDLPGHERGASHDPATYADLASMLDERLPDGPLDAVAFSLGGKLALAIAARRSGRFRRLVIGGVGDNLFAPEPAGEALATALVAGVAADAPAAIAALVDHARRGGADPRALAAVLRRPANPRLDAADLAAVGEVLLINGDADTLALPDTRLRRALLGARAVHLPGVDHLALPASPEFRDLALAHLAGGAVNKDHR